jgi:hypothetical protein
LNPRFELFVLNPVMNPSSRDGWVLAFHAAMPIEVVIGRWLALCAHPFAAWRVLPASGRLLMLASYFASSYAAVLLTLLAL